MHRVTMLSLRIEQALLAQRGVLMCWVPVCLGLGVALYFGLRFEPSARIFIAIGLGACFALVGRKQLNEAFRPLVFGAVLVGLGFGAAGMRAHLVAGPVLSWRYYGPVEGRVVAIDRSQSDALRLTLDRVQLARIPPHKTPHRLRISLHGDRAQDAAPQPGMRVMTTAHLSPPSGPVEPGGFDFQRHAWFAQLGAVGYSRVPLLTAQRADPQSWELIIFRIRRALSTQVQARLPGDVGGFAAAITTGDRSGISQAALNALRTSNLAHLLAISGLHMGLLTTVVFVAMRIVLSVHPHSALHWPTKEIAACVALVAALAYLGLSGGNVATQRAFIMVAAALGALLLGRRALSLRAVALAATIVLLLRPEALAGPGFQMSFAATTALVAVFGWLRGRDLSFVPKALRPVLSVFISSAVAGVATAPIAAAHFNLISHYGLIANLLCVPLMGVLIMPAAVLALVLGAIGAQDIGLWVMGLGLRWILGVAEWIATLENARGYIVSPSGIVLPLLCLGFLFAVLWIGRARWLGVLAMITALGLWPVAERPQVLISDTGSLVGQMTPQGRALSKAKGAGFVARNWLENDGTGAGQAEAARLWQTKDIIHLNGKRALARFEGCRPEEIVIASVPLETRPSCRSYDPKDLQHTGSLALTFVRGQWQIVSAREIVGERLWTRWPKARRVQ